MGDDTPGDVEYSAAAAWVARRDGRANRALTALDAVTAVAETPVAVAGRSSSHNPLHHTGPITVFLFIVAFATGVYVTMFFQFGFEDSYLAVEQLEASFAGRVMRAAHRYSSIALVIVSIIHGWRTLVMRRFQKPRRTAWVTGVVMVAVVWLIGVTGYWLIWDQRAQVLNEALRRLVAGWSIGLDFMIDNVLTSAAGTGWPFMLLLFLIHFLLSSAVAALIWFHLRHLARPAWLPSPFWTAIVGGSLLVASVVLPLGTLPPVDPTRLLGRVEFDPFFLFLMPAATHWPPGVLWGGVTMLTAVVIGLPWLILRRRPAPVEVIAERCIGCTWCAADCPYGAITMVDDPGSQTAQLAAVVAARCVSCGICLGSCPTAALALEGLDPVTMREELAAVAATGAKTVVITCQRPLGTAGVASPTLALPCVGMAAPALLEAAVDLELAVELVGCPTNDCSFREGSGHTLGRLTATRPPRLRKAYDAAAISMTTAAAGRFARRSPAGSGWTPTAPLGMWRLGAVITLVALASILASRTTYDVGESQKGAVTVALDHRAGIPLLGEPDLGSAPSGATPQLTITIDGVVRHDGAVELVSADEPNTALFWDRFSIDPGPHTIRVALADGPTESARILFEETVTMDPGDALLLEYRDQEIVIPAEAGRDLFNDRDRRPGAGCTNCHTLQPGIDLVGPSLGGIATRAAATVPGLDAAAYLRQSIVDPEAYIVPGFAAGQMPADFALALEEDEIDNLVAFLLTVED